ncbi:MAG: carbamoyl-phosphate synthase domain-containing protein, partial [Endomicrobiia bacterium]
MKSILLLEDGSSFEGISIGPIKESIGKVILNTSVVGYQESITDPANAGKILVFTYPLIGNYGVAKKFNESKKCWVSGIVIKENSRIYSNWQAENSFDSFIKKHNVVTLCDVDTRTLAVHVRDNGEMVGIISNKFSNKNGLIKKLKKYIEENENEFIKEISVKKITKIVENKRGPDI